MIGNSQSAVGCDCLVAARYKEARKKDDSSRRRSSGGRGAGSAIGRGRSRSASDGPPETDQGRAGEESDDKAEHGLVDLNIEGELDHLQLRG